jgi:hypothetical protein
MSEFITLTSEDILRRHLQRTLATCVILLLPTLVFASGAAMLTTAGHATVNGNDSPSSSAVFNGDMIATAGGSAATIDSEGSMVLVMPNSSVQFKGNSVDMGNGDVVVTTTKAMGVKVGKFTIAPAAGQAAKFEVSHAAGMVVISARQGSLNISDGKSTQVLQEGQQTTRSDAEQLAAKDQTPASGTSAVHMSKTTALLLGGAIAGGAAAAIVLLTPGSSHAVSTTNP